MNDLFPNGANVFVIAEIGVNHNGDLATAERLIDGARRSGADAVKFQTFRAERLVTRQSALADYQQRNAPGAASQYEMLKRLELGPEQHAHLKRHCERTGIRFLSTPFDEESADLLERLGVEAFKISSGDLTDLSLLDHVARKQRPMLVSTGMATLDEVGEAVATIRRAGAPDFCLFHCVSDYPATLESCNLRALTTLQSAFGCPVGWSDHTVGIESAIAAVALGARFIEKHVTLDRAMPGPDHMASMPMQEFERFVASIRGAALALGTGEKRPTEAEQSIRKVVRKTLVVVRDLEKGDVFDRSNLAMKRAGSGLPGTYHASVLGRRASRAVAADTILSMDMVE